MSGLFSTPKIVTQTTTPKVIEPTVMPTVDDAAMREKKRKSLVMQMARQGRASTILSSVDKLG